MNDPLPGYIPDNSQPCTCKIKSELCKSSMYSHKCGCKINFEYCYNHYRGWWI